MRPRLLKIWRVVLIISAHRKKIMKKIFLFIITALATGVASAQYKPVNQGSSLQFNIKNFGFNVTGSFTGLEGDITFDPQNPAASNFDVSVNAASVNTDNNLRDHHLQGDTYFDVKNYPRIRFVSTKVTATGKNGGYTITGNLTIKKQTKVISFPFTAMPANDGYVFKGTFNINRKDFDVGGTSTIANNLEVSLNILTKKG
jgi:polyisoprenoid-binding protein YceI